MKREISLSLINERGQRAITLSRKWDWDVTILDGLSGRSAVNVIPPGETLVRGRSEEYPDWTWRIDR